MIEQAMYSGGNFNTQTKTKVFRMVKSERMGGFMPVWENVRAPRYALEERLSLAQSGQVPENVRARLAYRDESAEGLKNSNENAFGFGDLVDMVNPLHHIPLVGYLYRKITGDQIKPIGNIIGGALFAGPLGAASGLVNMVIEAETGKDIPGNALALARSVVRSDKSSEEDFPGALLAVTDLRQAGRFN